MFDYLNAEALEYLEGVNSRPSKAEQTQWKTTLIFSLT